MKQMILCGCAALTAAALAGSYLAADQGKGLEGATLSTNKNIDEGGIAGGGEPDVTVSRLGLNSSGSGDDFHYYGSYKAAAWPESMRIRAFSAASTSCNIGSATAQWISGHSGGSAGKHPVIAQNVYRLLDGKFEQIGQSWLKHSFCAVSEPTCGDCQSTSCGTLGIGCADTYWATLNGDQGDLGPRHEINPWPAVGVPTHTASPTFPGGPSGTINGRMQIRQGDIDAGGDNFFEIQYITHDEPYARRYNNSSWRPVNLSSTSISGIGSGQPSVRFQEFAMHAWKDADPEVDIVSVDSTDDVPQGDGRFNVGYRIYDNGDGTWDYEFAVQNMNSRRGAQSFKVPLRPGVSITNPGFHDVEYHSGDGESGNYDGTDWDVEITDAYIQWSTTPHADDANANAIRWGTLYNFRFTADSGPVTSSLTMGLYLPSTNGTGDDDVQFFALAPDEVDTGEPCDADTNDDGMVDVTDLTNVILAWGSDDPSADIDGNGVVDVSDLTAVILAWGACP
ncbi:MAG: hypothetical protein ACYTF9_09535 [Planctomycetota bacterium]|jgi:hypothetical protein